MIFRLSPRSARLLLLTLVLALAGAAQAAPRPKAAEKKDELESVIAELNVERGSGWWDPAWSFRRTCTVHDPRLSLFGSEIFLTAPDPLLLANTRLCAPALADLRAVTLGGEPMPCGVTRFGQDDGLSLIWLRPPATAKPPFIFFLYYGNPAAAARPDPEPGRIPEDADRMSPAVSPEETAPARAIPAGTNPAFFSDLVMIEAEDCVTACGKPAFTYDRQPPQMAWLIKAQKDDPMMTLASAGAYLASTCPWRPQAVPEPVVAWTRARIPSAGRWQVYVRYKTTRYYPPSDRGKGGQPTPEHYVPFDLTLGGQTFTCGTNQAPGALFRWDHVEVDLPAGELEVRFRMAGMSAPDCVLLTRDPAYRPDHRDVNGPVWMRFRVPAPSFGPFFIELFCFITPWSTHGAQGESAGFLFRDQVVRGEAERDLLRREPANMLKPGDWSPWIQTRHSTMRTWWSHVRFYPAGRGLEKGGASDITVDFEFATRPDPSRVFRTGTETWTGTPGLYVLMPQRLDWQEVERRTRSFSQWARQRFELVRSLNLPPAPGPSEIMATTMSTSVNDEETEYILRTCGLLGFNGIEVRNTMPPDIYVKKAAENGLTWTTAHHWAPKFGLADIPARPAAGLTATDTLKAFLAAQSRECYKPGPRWGLPGMPVKLLIMGDEIGPATMAAFINAQPLQRAVFYEYLKDQGLTPEFFGKAIWDEVEAFSYHALTPGSEAADALLALQNANGQAPDPGLQEAQPALPDSVSLTPAPEEGAGDLAADEEQRQVELRLAKPADPKATLEEKRRYHWTQRFRSYYTTLFYSAASAEIKRRAVELKLPWQPVASPNFQAMPIMCGQMWDGALNLFEWARSGTTDFLMMEDWINGPYRVAFGQRLLAAAARKKGQTQGALIVADAAPRQRYLMALANGARVFLSYLYGPLQVIGPAWAEDELTVKTWAETLAWTGRLEKELLGSELRPAQAALLIANTAEINSPYLRTSLVPSRPLSERQNVFAALMDAQVPVEIVGEEEIIEDGALDRYRALYVTDPHVDHRAQEKIKEWVRGGGVLWATHGALVREEYDTPATRFDEVFGLADRGPVVQPEKDQGRTNSSARVVVAGSAALPAVSFDAYPIRPAWKLGAADVLATFADNGAPVLIHNAFGKGHAYLFGNSANACNAGFGHTSKEPEWAARARELVAIGARTAKVAPSITLSHARVLWTVRDGPGYTLLVLANGFDGRLEGLKVDLVLPRRPAEVLSGRGQKRPFEWDGSRVRLVLNLEQADGEILLFR